VAERYKPADVTYEIQLESEDLDPDTMFSSDDPEADKAMIAEIRRRAAAGDEWAWCHVRVVATWGDYQGDDNLGGCSYESEADFKAGGYYSDMCDEARRALERNIEADRIGKARDAFVALMLFLKEQGIATNNVGTGAVRLPNGKTAFASIRPNGMYVLAHQSSAGTSYQRTKTRERLVTMIKAHVHR
jgi:hypothetical protein